MNLLMYHLLLHRIPHSTLIATVKLSRGFWVLPQRPIRGDMLTRVDMLQGFPLQSLHPLKILRRRRRVEKRTDGIQR